MRFRAKILFLCFLPIILVALFLLQQKKKVDLEILYDKEILNLPINNLKNLRYVSDEDKLKLFQEFIQKFAINTSVKKIKNINKPQIIVWFTDHFGQISKEGRDWYRQNIINPLSNSPSIFWLIDLAAWRFLSVKEKDLLKCEDFKNFLNRSKIINPLINDKTTLFDNFGDFSFYKFLHSKDFFIWLNQLPFSISSIDSEIANNLIRKDVRQDSAHFTLRQLGYEPQFLNVCVKKLNKNLLDLDNTQVFPLLQYLEGVYYVLKILENCINNNEECNIVFLLPNKEFTYYLTSNENQSFESFKNMIKNFITNLNPRKKLPKIKIYFYPFSYGTNFYDMPFEE